MTQAPSDGVSEIVRAIQPEMAAARRHLHQNPELSGAEKQTAAYVAERLRSWGLDARTDVGGHGVVATLCGGAGRGDAKRTFAIRADMDALPIQETSSLPYRSGTPGIMHACGHDGHTATALGAVRALSLMKDSFCGQVRFIFQPAEETVDGARRMCEDGVMEGVDAIVALHGWPGLDVGYIGVRDGAMMASSDTFEMEIIGEGAHAAMPHLAVDPIVFGAQVVLALQTVVSRETSPVEPVVVTVAQFHAGTAHNIIPSTASLKGTVRCLTAHARAEAEAAIRRIGAAICAAGRATCRIEYRQGTPVTVNDPEITRLIADVGARALGAEKVARLDQPSMGAEDFGVFLQHAPGAMFRLGVGKNSPPLHTSRYDFPDAALATGTELFTRLALSYLSSA